jgi:hypothetical protein
VAWLRSRRFALAGTTLAGFGIAVGALTGFEAIGHRPVAGIIQGTDDKGTTLQRVFGGGKPAEETATVPTTTPSPTATRTATTSAELTPTATATTPPAAAEPTQSPTQEPTSQPTEPTSEPTQSPEPAPTSVPPAG